MTEALLKTAVSPRQVDVTEKATYGDGKRKRYALRGKTKDGRNLTKFVSEADWKKASV